MLFLIGFVQAHDTHSMENNEDAQGKINMFKYILFGQQCKFRALAMLCKTWY
jgi:hypothetical protein